MRNRVFRWSYRHFVDFSAGKLYAQIIGDRLGDLAFHREHVGELAIISLGPEMRVGHGID